MDSVLDWAYLPAQRRPIIAGSKLSLEGGIIYYEYVISSCDNIFKLPIPSSIRIKLGPFKTNIPPEIFDTIPNKIFKTQQAAIQFLKRLQNYNMYSGV